MIRSCKRHTLIAIGAGNARGALGGLWIGASNLIILWQTFNDRSQLVDILWIRCIA